VISFYKDIQLTRLVDGGYISWTYGPLGFQSWNPYRKNYIGKTGTLICMDSDQSLRKEYYPLYKSHRVERREKRQETHEMVLIFKETLHEDPSLNLVEFTGLEGDDILALLAPRFRLPVTGTDKDLLQLKDVRITRVDGSPVTMLNIQKREPKYIQPYIRTHEDVLLILTLMGDKSDDIPRLIPPRQLEIMTNIMQSRDRWKIARSIFKDELLRNLCLAVLPSPWCFDPVPSPEEVFDWVRKGRKNSWKLRSDIQDWLRSHRNVLP
jgi:hypothetical protein